MSQPDSIWQAPLRDFRNAIESRATPGCGAAAAVSAGFGLALILKGLRLGEAKHPRTERDALIVRGDALEDVLSRSADDDVAAFNAYLMAIKLPHQTTAESQRRDEAIQAAAVQACAIPLAIARACRDGLALSGEALAWTSSQLQSDTRAGALLLHAGLSAVLQGVDANLPSLHDAVARDAMARERRVLQDEADARLEALK